MQKTKSIDRVETALNELRLGKMLILVDGEDREHEGDLVLAAEKATPEAINFMSRYARGLMCLPMTEEYIEKLDLPLMPKRNSHSNQASFTVSIDATQGITSGISAQDRAHTIRVVMDPASTHHDISFPGHLFPLKAQQGGVLVRPGHTEGSVDLVTLAGLKPVAVIAEILNDDGTMARMPHLEKFAGQHGIMILTIEDIIVYRRSMVSAV